MAQLSKSCEVIDIGGGARLREPKEHDRTFSVDGKLMGGDGNTMCLQLRIVDQCCDGRSRNIQFPFNVHQDTPVSVMREMQATAVELQISEQEVLSVSLMIMEKVWALQSAVLAEQSTAPSTAQVTRHVQCREAVERRRRSHRRIVGCKDGNDSTPSCSSTSSSSGSSSRSSKRSQDYYSTSSNKLGSKVMSASGVFRYTQCDIDLAFSELNVRDLVASAKLTGLKQVHKQELQEMQQRHTQQYLDLKSRRLPRNSIQCVQPLWCA